MDPDFGVSDSAGLGDVSSGGLRHVNEKRRLLKNVFKKAELIPKPTSVLLEL